MERLISAFGIFVILGLAWLMSSNRRLVPWRLIGAGLTLQFLLAVITLRTTPGFYVFDRIGAFFTNLLSFVGEGSKFVFGDLAEQHYFAFSILPTIIFFSSLTSVLYYLGIMQRVVAAMAWVMVRTLRTSAAETLATSGNVFLGQTEAPLMIRPYVPLMTNSELNAVMVGGFATIAGGVMAAFVAMGIDAGHLVTASVISAPGALMIAKILVPETEEPMTLDHLEVTVPQPASNLLEAAANGASEGLSLALNIAAMLIAFLALLAMCDAAIGWVGSLIGRTWSLQIGLSYLFYPLAWVMGVPSQDCLEAGRLLGVKMVLTEFQAYAELGNLMEGPSETRLNPRTETIMTYALCGFSNFGSIGIQIGGLGQLAPERRGDLSRLGFRAMLGGTLACCLTAAIAGMLV